MLFYSYFKTLVGKEVTVELKNDLAITGILHSVDQYLNVKLDSVRVVNEQKYPQMMSVKNCFIRGSVVRYVQVKVVLRILADPALYLVGTGIHYRRACDFPGHRI